MKDIVTNLIEKIIIPEYGELNYELSGLNSMNIKYSDLPIDKVHDIVEDTKMLLKMLGLVNVKVTNYNRDPWFIIITGYYE